MQPQRFFDQRTTCSPRHTLSRITSNVERSLELASVTRSLRFSSRYDFFQRSNGNGLTSSMSSSINADLQPPSYASDMRILMENMQALNVNHRQDDFLLSGSSSLKDSAHQGRPTNFNGTVRAHRSPCLFSPCRLPFQSQPAVHTASVSFEPIPSQRH